MCVIAYDLFGNIKRKRCKEDNRSIDKIAPVNWSPPFLIQHFSISPTYTVYYKRNCERSSGRKQSLIPKSNKTNGSMSKKASRKVRYCFNWLIAASKVKQVYKKSTGKTHFFKLNFITLTLSEPQKHTDNFIKANMLAQFIQWMQRRHGVVSYIWKAEAQMNGNIHFHITTNKFIHWQQIRHKWNSIQFKHGYNRGLTELEFCTDTNSTDVHAVKKEALIIGYMCKYFTKDDTKCSYVKISCDSGRSVKSNDGLKYYTDEEGLLWMKKRSIVGRLWNHSSNLLTTGFSVDETDSAYSDWRNMLNYYATGKPIHCDFATVIPHKRVGVKEMPSSVRVLLQNKIDLINAKDKATTVYQIA